MRDRRFRLLPVGLLLLVALASCGDLSPETPGGRNHPAAGNPMGGCDICHVDVVDDLAGTKHPARGVGCIRCHGPSKPHLADENNEVKPDRVLTKKIVDAFCASCHKCSRPQPALTTSPAKPKTCIDCHGAHKPRRKTVSTQKALVGTMKQNRGELRLVSAQRRV